jgi:hypothetical protein
MVPELLRETLHKDLPHYTNIRLDSADLTEIQPAEYRADMVVLLALDEPVLGIVVEVQLSRDEDKSYVWPAYVFNLRSRLRCPAWLLVIAPDDAIACWARNAIEAGVGDCCRFLPWVIGLREVPEITEEGRALEEPELAVLSAIAHAKSPDIDKATRIALLAQMVSVGLDAERSTLYCDLVLNALPDVARQALLAMNPSNYEYQSEFARRYFGQGKAAGEAQGRIGIVLRQLTVRYGDVSPAEEACVRNADSADLDHIAERLLTAATLQEALGAPATP